MLQVTAPTRRRLRRVRVLMARCAVIFGALGIALSLAVGHPATSVTSVSLAAASGTGSVESSRGHEYVSRDGVALTGGVDLFAPFTAATTGSRSGGSSWSGSSWSGSSWSGSSRFASSRSGSSWSGSSWSGSSWSGNN